MVVVRFALDAAPPEVRRGAPASTPGPPCIGWTCEF